MKKFLLISLIFFLLLPISCSKKVIDSDPPPPPPNDPTTGELICKVKDSQSQYVLIEGARVSIGGITGQTDRVGSVWLQNIPAGMQNLEVSKSGYNTFRGDCQIMAGKVKTVDVFLEETEPETETVTLYSTGDSYIDDGNRTTNWGTLGAMRTGYIWFGNHYTYYKGFVKFNLSSIPSSAEIVSARLRLAPDNNTGGLVYTANTLVSRVDDKNWNETGITWSNAPEVFQFLSTIETTFGGNTNYYFWDVKSAIQDWVSGDEPNYGLMILSREIDGGLDYGGCYFYTRETGSGAVSLLIEYQE